MQHIVSIVVEIQYLPFLEVFLGANKDIRFLSNLFDAIIFELVLILNSIVIVILILAVTHPSLLYLILVFELVLKLVVGGLLLLMVLFFHAIILIWDNLRKWYLLYLSCFPFYLHYFRKCLAFLVFATHSTTGNQL